MVHYLTLNVRKEHIYLFQVQVSVPFVTGIKARMQHEGKALIGFQSVNGFPNFFRLVLPNPWSLTFQDVDEILETMDEIGQEVDRGLTLAQLARAKEVWEEL